VKRGLRAGDIALALLFAALFAFAPVRSLRVAALFCLFTYAAAVIPALVLPRAVSVRRREQVLRVNRGQQVEVTLEVTNRWILPLRSVLVTDRLGGLFATTPPVFLVSLRPRETRVLAWTAEARERGELTVGPVDLEGPGLLGLRRWRAEGAALLKVLIYPAVFPLTLEHRKGLPAGTIPVLNRLYEDVSRFRSLREYTPGDELRRINWKVSARMGKLHTMEYVPALSFPVLVLLDLTSADYPLSMRRHLIERAIEIAASLVVAFANLRQEVGILSTAVMPGGTAMLSVPTAPGSEHAVRILEALALARPCDEPVDFTALVPAQGAAGTRVLAVTPALSPERAASLRALARRGWQVEAWLIGETGAGAGMPVHEVGAGEEVEVHG
jgi:uncharacterized protein (DUF58 family)